MKNIQNSFYLYNKIIIHQIFKIGELVNQSVNISIHFLWILFIELTPIDYHLYQR